MTNAVNTTKVVSGLSHHRSDRSVLSSMRALVRPRTPASVDAIATSVAPVNPQCGSQYESQVNPGVRGVALAATHEKTTQHTRKRKGARHDHTVAGRSGLQNARRPNGGYLTSPGGRGARRGTIR